MVDALGPRAEEGRGKTTKSLGEPSGRLSRGYPNGRNPSRLKSGKPRLVGGVSRGTETSKYPEEKKSTEIPLVVANERGIAQTWLA